MIAYCEDCKLPYIFKRGSSKCLVCWKEEREYDLSKADLAHKELARAFHGVLVENTALKASGANGANVKQLEAQVAQLTAQMNTLRTENENLRKGGNIPQDTLRSLISLCHPDRHSGSSLATKMTQWLVAQLRR
jgi:hypothetical protein